MKIKSIYKSCKIMVLATMLLAVSSCNDSLLDINVDPNNPTSVPAENLLTQAQFTLFNSLQGTGLNQGWGMLMVQHWAQNEYTSGSIYVVDGNSFDGSWTTFYSGILNELKLARQIITDGDGVGQVTTNQLAIIDLLSAYAFQTVVEMWGDVPYTEALSAEFPNPNYDSEEAIIKDLLAKMDAAVASMSASAGSFSSGDIVFDGDVASWKKLGASMLLRLAMRVSDVDSGLADQYVKKAIGYGVIASNDDNGVFTFSDDPSLANPLYVNNILGNRDDYCVSEILVNTLKEKEDPRLTVYAKPIPSGEIVGMPYGLMDSEAFALKDGTSRPATIREIRAPHIVMDFAETSFLLAEAVERGYTGGDAAEHYANGVTASMNFWGIDDADKIGAYVAANAYDSGNWKKSIGEQKWLAFYGSGVQAWAEQRRLDQPALPVPAAADIPNIPVRLPYPISEDERNGNQLKAVTSNPNDMSSKLWWDVN
jgi:hypothetical protein